METFNVVSCFSDVSPMKKSPVNLICDSFRVLDLSNISNWVQICSDNM